MLVITRRVGESIKLSGPGQIKFLGAKGNRASWGIIAPRGTKVVRSELLHPAKRPPACAAAPEAPPQEAA